MTLMKTRPARFPLQNTCQYWPSGPPPVPLPPFPSTSVVDAGATLSLEEAFFTRRGFGVGRFGRLLLDLGEFFFFAITCTHSFDCSFSAEGIHTSFDSLY